MASRQEIFKGNKHARCFPRIETSMFTWTILHQLLEKKLKITIFYQGAKITIWKCVNLKKSYDLCISPLRLFQKRVVSTKFDIYFYFNRATTIY
jgi:hypothetical protein